MVRERVRFLCRLLNAPAWHSCPCAEGTGLPPVRTGGHPSRSWNRRRRPFKASRRTRRHRRAKGHRPTACARPACTATRRPGTSRSDKAHGVTSADRTRDTPDDPRPRRAVRSATPAASWGPGPGPSRSQSRRPVNAPRGRRSRTASTAASRDGVAHDRRS